MILRILVPLGFVVLVGCASTPSAPVTPPQTIAPAVCTGVSHTVQKGETLWRISKMYSVDMDELVRLNRITDSTSIAVGQILALPSGTRPHPEPSTNVLNAANTDFIWPLKGRLVARFGQKVEGVANKGIDIAIAPDALIQASRNGRISFVGDLPGYGETIIVDHLDGFSTVYCGNTQAQAELHQDVRQGAVIAKAKNSGASQNNEALHFEIRKKHRPQNPLFYLD
jgi:murein DD-endopeptidase MepM/ murein hydrolase activator NlpD